MAKKVSPVVYVGAFAVVAYAVFVATDSPAPVTTKHKKVIRTASAVAEGITPEDLTAHFARYTGKRRNAFEALVTPPSPTAPAASAQAQVPQQEQWSLTGISTLNGTTSALVENPATGDTAFLKRGDTWHGLTVTDIRADHVAFVNALGQHTNLGFATTVADAGPKTSGPLPPLGTAPVAAPASGSTPYALPPLTPTQIQPLPGMANQMDPNNPAAAPAEGTTDDQGNAPGYGRRRGRGGRQFREGNSN